MAYGKGTQSSSDVTSVEMANLGAIAESPYEQTLVRIVKLSWTTREGKLVVEDLPRIDVRKLKKGAIWSKGLSMKLTEYRRLKALMPEIDRQLGLLQIAV